MTIYIKSTSDDAELSAKHEQLGQALACMLYNRNYSLYPILTLQYWTENAIAHRQIRFLFDNRGLALAYITWAYLLPDTVGRLRSDPEFRLHPSEWDEAGEPWILDFCCKPGYGYKAAERFRQLRPWGPQRAHWLSRRKHVITCRMSGQAKPSCP
ncbi:MAG TPA: hypothetical protein VJS90_10845 [Pseudomonas sp.]|uniref:hypothetical protein n=1 Tax=Pseudomonas sp. TaxID=306 RepID=UPI002B463A24|nr:hypothetical protein [Pseudomonas sp.]HKS13522.1 hypothetical protein [Pseudomonas sp.]